MTRQPLLVPVVALFALTLLAGPAAAQATTDSDWTARMTAARRILDGRIEDTLRRGMSGFETMVIDGYPGATPAERAAMVNAMQVRLPEVIAQIQDMAARDAVQRFTLKQLEDPALQADAVWVALTPSVGEEVTRLARRLGAQVLIDACESQRAMSESCAAAVRDARGSLSR